MAALKAQNDAGAFNTSLPNTSFALEENEEIVDDESDIEETNQIWTWTYFNDLEKRLEVIVKKLGDAVISFAVQDAGHTLVVKANADIGQIVEISKAMGITEDVFKR